MSSTVGIRVLDQQSRLSTSSSPVLMVTVLILTDLLALLASVVLSVSLKLLFQRATNYEVYLKLWPFVLVFVAAYCVTGLYSGLALSSPEELRRTTLTSTFVFLLLAASTMSFRGAHTFFTWTLALAMFFSIGLIPLLRALVRHLFAHASWWGYPAVIFGSGKSAKVVTNTIRQHPSIGLKAIAVVDESEQATGCDVPVIWEGEVPQLLAQHSGRVYAVLAIPGMPQMSLLAMIEKYGALFSRVLIIPDVFTTGCVLVSAKSVGGMLGLEVSRAVLLPGRRITKMILDLVLSTVVGIFITPIMVLIALAIKLDSKGPVLFGHRRIGQGGRTFKAWKFRSMHLNSEQVLKEHLDADPALRLEWEENHKLKDDPRVTRVGRFLRKTSLDELPQLFNVFVGEMSLVGPRPIVQDEVAKYGAHFDLYTRVRGGVTGLWQVSGRNDTSYEERVTLDAFYVRNWSVWLDACILFRTIGTVLFRKGAY